MKTTLELLNQLFGRVQPTAAKRGQSLKEFVTKAPRHKLRGGHTRSNQPEWMQGFGKLKRTHKETVRVQSVIDGEFEVVELEDRR